jgi:hypothetical protein
MNLNFKNFKRTLTDDEKDVQQITDSYSEIIRAHPTADASGEIRAKIKELNTRWEILNGTVQETMKNVREKNKRFVWINRIFVLAEIYVKCTWGFSINTRFFSTLVNRS